MLVSVYVIISCCTTSSFVLKKDSQFCQRKARYTLGIFQADIQFGLEEKQNCVSFVKHIAPQDFIICLLRCPSS